MKPQKPQRNTLSPPVADHSAGLKLLEEFPSKILIYSVNSVVNFFIRFLNVEEE